VTRERGTRVARSSGASHIGGDTVGGGPGLLFRPGARRATELARWRTLRQGGAHLGGRGPKRRAFGSPGGHTERGTGDGTGRWVHERGNGRQRTADDLGREPPARSPHPLRPQGCRESSRHAGGRSAGSRDAQPHGREWPKHATGFEEEQAVKVVGNGAGGTTRVWKPAARFGPRGSSRDTDSSSWERRRGEQLHGRRDAKSGRPRWGCRGARTGRQARSSRVSARSWVEHQRPGNRTYADRRKTPGSTPRGERTEAEPGSQTNGYGGP
jgi:hypothetical protein